MCSGYLAIYQVFCIIMCSTCKETWDIDPLGIMSRYCGGNRQSLCKSCWHANKKIHESVVNGTKSFQFINPTNPNASGGGVDSRPPLMGSVSDLRLRHEEETSVGVWRITTSLLMITCIWRLGMTPSLWYVLCFKHARGMLREY